MFKFLFDLRILTFCSCFISTEIQNSAATGIFIKGDDIYISEAYNTFEVSENTNFNEYSNNFDNTSYACFWKNGKKHEL